MSSRTRVALHALPPARLCADERANYCPACCRRYDVAQRLMPNVLSQSDAGGGGSSSSQGGADPAILELSDRACRLSFAALQV